jgi:hypothetical protein
MSRGEKARRNFRQLERVVRRQLHWITEKTISAGSVAVALMSFKRVTAFIE